MPNWEGAKTYSFLDTLSFRASHRAHEWSAPDDGFDFSVYESRGFSFGPVAATSSAGIAPTTRAGCSAFTTCAGASSRGLRRVLADSRYVATRIELRHGSGFGDGFVADAAVDYLWHFGSATFAFGPRLGLGDQDFLRREYGVTLTDALQNGSCTPFKPDGGLRSAGVATSVTYDLSQAWSAVPMAATTGWSRTPRRARW